MSEQRRLIAPPITEAVIDLRCQLGTNFDFARFRALEKKVGYGPAKEMSFYEFGLRHEPGQIPQGHEVSHGSIGVRFDSADGSQVVQFRKDGFTFSRLVPYTSWNDVFAEASRCYRLFVEAAQPVEVNRPAVRYINRLLLPAEKVGDFSTFLTAPPVVPGGSNVFLTGFFNQVQIQEPDKPISATITQTVQSGGEPSDKVPVILDIDVFETSAHPPAPEHVLPRFGALREAKNRYFFASITDKTLELFQ